MGVFSSALDGAVRGAQKAVMNNLQTENDLLKDYLNYLSYGASLYRAIARGQIVAAAKYYGNYEAAREIVKKRYHADPEEDSDFIPLKRKFVEQYAVNKFKDIERVMAEDGRSKAYASVSEVKQDKMDFITLDELIRRAMDEPSKNPAPNYVTSPFGSTAPQEEKKKEKGSWFFGKK